MCINSKERKGVKEVRNKNSFQIKVSVESFRVYQTFPVWVQTVTLRGLTRKHWSVNLQVIFLSMTFLCQIQIYLFVSATR